MAKFRERNMADYELVPGGLYDKYIGRKKETKSLNTLWEEKRKERMKARGIKRMSQEALDAPCTIEAKDICIEGALMLLKALWKSLEKDYYLCPKKRAGIEEYIMSPDFGKLYFNLEPEYVINMLREKYNK